MLTNNSQPIAIKDLVDVSNINRCLPSFYPPHHCEKYSVFSKWCWQESKYGSIFSQLAYFLFNNKQCIFLLRVSFFWEPSNFKSTSDVSLCHLCFSRMLKEVCALGQDKLKTGYLPYSSCTNLELYVKNSIVSTKLYICIAIFSYYLLSRKHFGRMLLVQTLI